MQQRRQKLIEPIEQTEQVRTPDGVERLPCREDDQRNGQPAERFDLRCGCPNALIVIQHIIKAAEAGDTRAEAGGQIFVLRDADAGGVRSRGVFADGAQIQADPRMIQDSMQDDGQNDGGIDHETVVEDRLADNAQTGKHGQLGLKGFVDHALRGGASVENVYAEKVCHAHAKRGQRKAGHVLIGAQADGQKAVNQAAQHRRGEGAEQRNHDAERHVRIGGGVLIQISACETGESAQIHDARHAEVQVAAFFGDNFAHCAVHDDGAEGDGAHDPCDKRIHQQTSLPAWPRKIAL